MKLHISIEKIILIILGTAIVISGVFGLTYSRNIQLTKPFQQGYYKVFKDEELIGTVEKIDDIKNNLLKKYGNKANLDIYFGDKISIEYVEDEAHSAEFTPTEDIIKYLDVKVDGLIVKTVDGQVFNVTSYNDWRQALGNVVQFVAENDANKHTAIGGKGDVKVAENFTYAYEKIPIEQVMDVTEAENKLLYNDEANVKTDTVQLGDTLESFATRNNMSTVQVKYANDIKTDNMLVPGTQLNISELNYAVDFSYPIIENVTEDIAFEIEYIDDAEIETGTEEIKQVGINGKARAKYISNIINGQSVPGQRLEYEVIEEPVKQIVHKGTKPKQITTTTTTGAGEIKTDAPYANEAGFIWPTIGICISAEYGWYEYGAHKGLDIAGSGGESIWAAAAGTVESAEYSGAFGNQVLVNHNNGLKTRYAHLQSIGVNKGQEIKQGQYVGGMGSTGMSEANHLHFEVHANGERLNPRGYLPSGGPKTC